MAIRIGALASETGVPASTIRYYEQLGLLPGVTRTTGGNRRYSGEAVLRLQMIRAMQALGFSLEQMQVFFQHEGQDLEHDEVLAAIDGQLESLHQLIQSLQAKHRALKGIRALLEDTWDAGRCVADDQLKALVGSILPGSNDKP
ncbi:Mercuric resistance operon regulatory protein [Microbulbifer aggregans]|uniref:Mercuric resistance operon regulatory protein n=1 Tax=Microbulbifer aggregans TaxID=1769779 RepID=A0A1C9W4V0_9GAMM|nr:MerR family transcriptional regulator [Microbulbifer aggregans]AOS96162.1 Mercuric resistance operon regulatory protein [Microbulbifer aggregans]